MTEDAAWTALADELRAWRRAGRWATVWLRDDDVVTPTPALGRLLDLSLPVVLAAIPAHVTDALKDHLRGVAHAWVTQHGWSHSNHAPEGEKKCELGNHRPLATVLDELRRGQDRLAGFANLLPAMVPPWNRIDAAVLDALPALGFRGVSTYGPRGSHHEQAALVTINTHADIIDWHGSGGFAGAARILGLITGHLAARRNRQVDGDEPTGILTHHLVHDAACWAFLSRLAETPGLVWLPGDGLWAKK
jgi:hypothetical protein